MVAINNRSTTEWVIILLSGLIAAFVIILLLGVVISKLIHPEVDPRNAIELLGNIITTVVGAVVGFVGGRAAGKLEANGPPK